MNPKDFFIHPDVSQSTTLPSAFYRDQDIFDQVKEKVFARAWHCIGLSSDVQGAGSVQPFVLMDGFLDEPLLLVVDESEETHCLSNVCTHRGNILVDEGGVCSEFRCKYHGRRFDLTGKFKSMPEFNGVKNFPTEADHLPRLPLHTLGNLLFTSIHSDYGFETWMKPVRDRIGWMPLDEFYHSPEYSRTYTVNAHWALYVDNYLEGFHIPFVHPGLNHLLKFSEYSYEVFPWCNLQLGIAREGDFIFDLPEGHPDSGKQVMAYYFWLFPNIMLNFYPWGLSLNLIQPVSTTETQVRFETFIWKEELFSPDRDDLMHLTELEDEVIVESVQRGIRSRLYKKGRFSAKQEVAVHHFHRLLSEALVGKAEKVL